jgi:hypothetical protein
VEKLKCLTAFLVLATGAVIAVLLSAAAPAMPLAAGSSSVSGGAESPLALSGPASPTKADEEGCGPDNRLDKAVPEKPLGFDFHSACVQHDRCYGTPGEKRANCDKQFYGALKTYCGQFTGRVMRYECRGWADKYFIFVRAVGWTRFPVNVSLYASPSRGRAPLRGVDLIVRFNYGTAEGTVNYTFYCDRSDAGTDFTEGPAAKFDGVQVRATTFSARDVCTYETPGKYTAKVIVERGGALAEARATVVVRP